MITHLITILGFVLIFASVAGLEAVARLRPRAGVPSIEECLGFLMSSRAGRVLILLGWWWTGWHFFAR